MPNPATLGPNSVGARGHLQSRRRAARKQLKSLCPAVSALASTDRCVVADLGGGVNLDISVVTEAG